jgi:hypothetical protein
MAPKQRLKQGKCITLKKHKELVKRLKTVNYPLKEFKADVTYLAVRSCNANFRKAAEHGRILIRR